MGQVSRTGARAGRILVFLFCLVEICGLEAQLEPPRAVPNELIVLLPPASDPVAVVAAINHPSPSQSIPYGLGTASPLSAKLLIEPRPVGTTLQWMLNHPHRPLSRLHRYILLRYPSGTDTTNVRATLEGIGEVEHVEPNYTFELHSALVPNDPLLGQPGESVTASQWGTHVLRLPEAWEWSKGHTPIGFLDTGVDREHEDLKTWRTEGTPPRLVLNGGNVREHLSFNHRRRSCDIAETSSNPNKAGHGSHTTGIAAAATANMKGVSGACWYCPVQMQLAVTNDALAPGESQVSELENTAPALKSLSDQGAPVINMSVAASGFYECPFLELSSFCTNLALVKERDQVFVASAGNLKYPIGFPANDPRAIAVGGVERDFSSPLGFARWDDCAAGGHQCGSNHGIEMDVVAPAKEVLSTVFKGKDHLVDCGDTSAGTPTDGYGLCTGTSMAAPYVAGIVGLIRSAQPLLNREQVRDVLISSGSHKDTFTNQLGYGVPYADVAVKKALGSVGGQTLNNRLTPLFSLYSVAAEIHVLTPWPSEALAFVFDPIEPFGGAGQSVPGYLAFPGYEVCTISPCPDATPRSTFSVFTTHRQIPGMPQLVPLYRVRFDYGHYWRCTGDLTPRPGRSFAYATTTEGVEYFKREVTAPVPGAPANTQIGYELDGILGYIFPRCSPEPSCMPPGTTRLRRFYHPQRDDYVLFPEEQLAYWQSLGYVETTTLSTVLGYVYANTDTDYDGLIDGFEDLIGTKKNVADTDCDGISDGAEVGTYDLTLHGYRDPLAGPCTYLFADGFETGNTARWSSTSFLDDGIDF